MDTSDQALRRVRVFNTTNLCNVLALVDNGSQDGESLLFTQGSPLSKGYSFATYMSSLKMAIRWVWEDVTTLRE